MANEVESLASKIGDELRALVGEDYQKWTHQDRALVNLCLLDAAKIAIRVTAGQDVSREKAHVDAQLVNIKVAGTSAVSNFLWAAAAKVLSLGATLLIG